MKKSAFTLIELLVVIAVIALLLAIITPALQKAKQAAMTVICESNLKAYGQVGNIYLDDNDQYFPDSARTVFEKVEASNPYCQWHDLARSPNKRPDLAGVLIPYLSEEEDINRCPVFTQVAKLYGADHQQHVASIPIEPMYGYSMNAYLSVTHDNKRPSQNNGKTLKSVEVTTPARTFFFGEENLWVARTEDTNVPINRVPLNDNSLYAIWEGGPMVDAPLDFGPQKGDTFQDSFATFHKTRLGAGEPNTAGPRDKGVSVAVFLDSHVEIVTWQDTWRFSKTK